MNLHELNSPNAVLSPTLENTELRVGRSFLNQEKKGNMNYSNANATLGTELGQMSITVHRWDTLSHATLQTPKSWVNLKKEKKERTVSVHPPPL